MITVGLPPSGEISVLKLQLLLLIHLVPRAETGIISNSTFREILRSCNFSDVGPFVTSIKLLALLHLHVMWDVYILLYYLTGSSGQCS